MVVAPDCRYGHGALAREVKQYSMREVASAGTDALGELSMSQGRSIFRVDLWRCPACRYVEMFDPD